MEGFHVRVCLLTIAQLWLCIVSSEGRNIPSISYSPGHERAPQTYHHQLLPPRDRARLVLYLDMLQNTVKGQSGPLPAIGTDDGEEDAHALDLTDYDGTSVIEETQQYQAEEENLSEETNSIMYDDVDLPRSENPAQQENVDPRIQMRYPILTITMSNFNKEKKKDSNEDAENSAVSKADNDVLKNLADEDSIQGEDFAKDAIAYLSARLSEAEGVEDDSPRRQAVFSRFRRAPTQRMSMSLSLDILRDMIRAETSRRRRPTMSSIRGQNSGMNRLWQIG